jgi:hypothetical protein
MKKQSSMAERQTLGDAIGIGRIHAGQTPQRTAAFGGFGLRQVAPAGARTQDLSAGRNLETFGHGLFGFDAFGTSHKILNSILQLQKGAHFTRQRIWKQARIF